MGHELRVAFCLFFVASGVWSKAKHPSRCSKLKFSSGIRLSVGIGYSGESRTREHGSVHSSRWNWRDPDDSLCFH